MIAFALLLFAAPLAPRHPAVPSGAAPHPIDRFLARYFMQHHVKPPAPVSDALFVRRAYLDAWGLLPTPEASLAFTADHSPDKRARLVRELLANRPNYAEHWISFWNDLLRNDEGVIYHGQRESIGTWLYAALENNLPYDRFASALLHPAAAGDPKGFLMGVNWRGAVSASQIPAMQAAQNTAQIFLGVNLKCNSCHDSFISSWKLADAYGLASFFSEQPLEMYRCDKATGRKAELRFLYPELGSVPSDRPLEERESAAARLFTGPENGRFARTFVNRIWDRLFGRGIVGTVDDMDAKPFDADLLDWLASDFAEHGYDIRFLIERIMTSDAYALTSLSKPERESGEFVFRGPYARRLTAEQFADALASITGEWKSIHTGRIDPGRYAREWRFKSSPLTRALGRPIRDQVYTTRASEATMLQALEVMNGATFANLLHRGAGHMLGTLAPSPVSLWDSSLCGGGGVSSADVDIDISRAKKLVLVVEDVDSYDAGRTVAGWANAQFFGPAGPVPLEGTRAPLALRDRPPAEGVVMKLGTQAVYDIAGKGYMRFRATAGLDRDSWASDINPKVRFYVFDQEPDWQQLVRVAGKPPVPFAPWRYPPDQLTARLYEYALSRAPSPQEAQMARSMAGSSDGLEDLLWAVFLLPEFQYIR